MKSTATDTEAPPTLPLKLASRHYEIVNLLALLGHGEALDCLQEDIRDAEKAVSEVGKAAEVSLKIKIAPNGNGKRILTYETKVKKPVLPSSSTYAFVTPQGQFVENDPEQGELALKVVSIQQQPPKVVGQ